MSQVMLAMSGGVDSSVAAALLLDAGHDVVGVTMKLWGGPSDTGCCAISDVADARRVADRLGIEHHVFNFADEFERDVVVPYAAVRRVGQLELIHVKTDDGWQTRNLKTGARQGDNVEVLSGLDGTETIGWEVVDNG